LRRLPWFAWALLLGLVGSALLVWGWNRFQCDDAFISYRYAANLAAGHGLVFNPGERVEGYSNLLLILLMAGGLLVGIPPTVSGPLLGVMSLLAVLAGAWAVVWNAIAGWTTAQRVCASLMLFALVTSHGLAAAAGSGLETMLFAALVFFAAVLWAGATRPLVLTALLALLVLLRPDGIVPAATLLLLEGATAWRRALRLGALPAATAAVLALWKIVTYGTLFPNPYYAKGADVPQLAAGFAYAWTFLMSYPVVPVLLGAMAWLLVRSRGNPAWRLALAGTALLLTYGATLVRVGGDFMDYRLFWHVLPVVLFAGVVALVELFAARPRVQAVVAAIVLLLSCAPVRLESVYYMQTLPEMQRYVEDGTAVGRALRRLPGDAVVATTLIGTIGYYSGLRLVDQWGLVDPDVRTRPARNPFVRGHLKFTAAPEALRKGADLLLEHPSIRACDREVLKTEHDAGYRLDDGRCVRVLVLSARPDFRALVCSDHERFPVLGPEVCSP
jgi:arabinofuranosyltransferase